MCAARLSTNSIYAGVIDYHELLKHLSVAFQGGEDEANILAEFYSRAQKPKESKETFADELQLLTRKVISKRSAFREGLDTTLKQHYANQLYDRNSSSIAKTLLLQMPTVTFTWFRNELARVLGMHQRKDKPKSVTSNNNMYHMGALPGYIQYQYSVQLWLIIQSNLTV